MKVNISEFMEPWPSRIADVLQKFNAKDWIPFVSTFLKPSQLCIEGRGEDEDDLAVLSYMENTMMKSSNYESKDDGFTELEHGTYSLQIEDNDQDVKQYSHKVTVSHYMCLMSELNRELRSSWQKGEKIQSLKIVIQCLKMLSFINVKFPSDIEQKQIVKFYPNNFIMITDMLDSFGQLLLLRINSLQGPEKICVFKQWLFKSSSIRELISRLYIECALLLLHNELGYLDTALLNNMLANMMLSSRGLSHILVRSYFQCYLMRTLITLMESSQQELNVDANILKIGITDFLKQHEALDVDTKLEYHHPLKLAIQYNMQVYWWFEQSSLNITQSQLNEMNNNPFFFASLDQSLLSNRLPLKNALGNSLVEYYHKDLAGRKMPSVILLTMLTTLDHEIIIKNSVQIALIIRSLYSDPDIKPQLIQEFGQHFIELTSDFTKKAAVQTIEVLWNDLLEIKDLLTYLKCIEIWCGSIFLKIGSGMIGSLFDSIIEKIQEQKGPEEAHHVKSGPILDCLQKVAINIVQLLNTDDLQKLYGNSIFKKYLGYFKQTTHFLDICFCILDILLENKENNRNFIRHDVPKMCLDLLQLAHEDMDSYTSKYHVMRVENYAQKFLNSIRSHQGENSEEFATNQSKQFEEYLSLITSVRGKLYKIEDVNSFVVDEGISLCEKMGHISGVIETTLPFVFSTVNSIKNKLKQCYYYSKISRIALDNERIGISESSLTSAAMSMLSFLDGEPAMSRKDEVLNSLHQFIESLLHMPISIALFSMSKNDFHFMKVCTALCGSSYFGEELASSVLRIKDFMQPSTDNNLKIMEVLKSEQLRDLNTDEFSVKLEEISALLVETTS